MASMHWRRWTLALAALTVAAGLAGCASVYRVDNQVESFARWADTSAPSGTVSTAPTPPQKYRFERLPSQANNADFARWQSELEQLTQESLAPLGWTLAANAPDAHWSVEVTANALRLPRAPWEDPWYGHRLFWTGHVHVGVGRGQVFWNPWLMGADMPYYQREVALIVRDATTGKVVYETRSAHDGRWRGTRELWRAMLTAALQGFPSPPPGMRQIDLDVPR